MVADPVAEVDAGLRTAAERLEYDLAPLMVRENRVAVIYATLVMALKAERERAAERMRGAAAGLCDDAYLRTGRAPLRAQALRLATAIRALPLSETETKTHGQ